LPIEILFPTADLQRLCEQQKVAVRRLGPESARKLRTRLADLLAASAVGDLVAGHPHPLKGDRAGQFAVSLAGAHRLVFEPANDPMPRSQQEGAIDWARVTRVRVVFVGDYHD
jgi:proteic killer suppression protein